MIHHYKCSIEEVEINCVVTIILFFFFKKVFLNLINRSSSLKGNDLVTETGMFITAHITSLNNIKVKK